MLWDVLCISVVYSFHGTNTEREGYDNGEKD